MPPPSSAQRRAFDAVLTSDLPVRVRQGASPGITVLADRNLLPLLETVVKDTTHGRTLVVRWRADTAIRPKVAPVVTVQVAQVRSLVVEGNGDIVGEQLRQPRLAARLAGSGDIRLDGVVVDELRLDLAGSGDIVASGQTGQLSVTLAGSGDVRTPQLSANTVSVNLAGSGDVQVQAQRTLAVAIAGSGDVVYSGPRHRHQHGGGQRLGAQALTRGRAWSPAGG